MREQNTTIMNLFRSKTTTPDLRKSISRSPLRLAFLLIPFTAACVALSPTVRAVTPAPDGGYPGGNTAEGDNALLNLVVGTTTGINNTAIGFDALVTTTDGVSNTAIGFVALQQDTTGHNNTATGVVALQFNTTGSFNIATGEGALYQNTTGNDNTATGFQALFSNTADNNTANGFQSLFTNTTVTNNNG